jgi:hypothetical protein
MSWVVFLLMLIIMVVGRVRREQQLGRWSWSKFAFTLGFAGLECVIITAPLVMMDMNNPHFWPIYIFAWVAAAGLLVWFIIEARRWKLPDGRTSLEADRDNQLQPPPR